MNQIKPLVFWTSLLLFSFALTLPAPAATAPDKLVGIHSSRVMSQSFPWVAQEAGLFKKYNLDFNLVFISSSSIVTAALLGGDAEMTVTGGIGNVAAFVKGSTDIVFTGGVKNVMTQTLVAGGNIKKPEDLRGKRIAVSRIGGNSHYFTIQALRRYGMEPNRDYSFLQTGGDPETLTALLSGSLEVANLTPPTDAQAIAKGYHYVVYGPDLKIPYSATAFVTKRSVIAKRPQVIGSFMRAMAEASKIVHTDRDFWFKVLGKYLRLTDRSVLDSAYNAEIKALEPRLQLKMESLQAILDELAPTDPKAKNVRAQDMVDTRYLEEMNKSGFMDQLWGKK
ncbi:MAG: ABC transporter substrate-binding protein [Deltaproteobacteria bacterium]|nr:ABC transporter substrate-binding protein [Deltaproteobacteria bacterium]MBM4298557.1 ABC transporter substrate-binding protein [Deltaproteobacteria bacterium]